MGIFGKRGALRVELDRAVFRPGETVEGTVYLNVDKTIKAASLKVVVYGQEIMMWKRKIAKNTVYHHKSIDYLNEEIVLVPADMSFDVGETHYHFVCRLPLDAHPSFSYAAKKVRDLENVNVNTEYKIDATLNVRGLGASNLKDQAVFTVEALPTEAPIPQAIAVRQTDKVAFLAVFKRGSCDLSLDVPTNVFVPSSTIYARVGLAQDSSSTLKYLVLVLYEDAVVNRRDFLFKGLKSGSRIVTKRRVESNALGQPPYALELPITPNQIATDKKPLNPTMTAHFLTVTYRLAVECHFTMAGTITIDAPVTIVREHTHIPGNVGAPYAEMAFELVSGVIDAIKG